MKYEKTKRTLRGFLVAGAALAILPSPQVEAQGIGLRKLDQMLTPTESRVDRGAKIYAENCASCHGAEGKGGAEIASSFDPAPRGFTSGEFKYGGGTVQIYNVIAKGEYSEVTTEEGEQAEPKTHPVFNHLAYQDQWAVSHYVRSVGSTEADDPAEVLEQARFEAENGYCKEELKDTISERVAPGGEEQMQVAAEIYDAQCASCHGAEGAGDGPAGQALNPPARSFVTADEEWTNGSSPLAIFNTLTVGIEGTSMAAYSSLSEDERWALVHYVRDWMPEEALEEASEEEVVEVCRSLSAPPKPPSIPVDVAMRALVDDYPDRREAEVAEYGPVLLSRGSNASAGQANYETFCSDCHGPNGAGSGLRGPYGAFPPYLYLPVSRLTPAQSGGTVSEFAKRSLGGVHATLSDMSAASQMRQEQWRDLHAFVARFDGDGDVKFADEVPAVAPEEAEAPGEDEEPQEATPQDASSDEDSAGDVAPEDSN